MFDYIKDLLEITCKNVFNNFNNDISKENEKKIDVKLDQKKSC